MVSRLMVSCRTQLGAPSMYSPYIYVYKCIYIYMYTIWYICILYGIYVHIYIFLYIYILHIHIYYVLLKRGIPSIPRLQGSPEVYRVRQTGARAVVASRPLPNVTPLGEGGCLAYPEAPMYTVLLVMTYCPLRDYNILPKRYYIGAFG